MRSNLSKFFRECHRFIDESLAVNHEFTIHRYCQIKREQIYNCIDRPFTLKPQIEQTLEKPIYTFLTLILKTYGSQKHFQL